MDISPPGVSLAIEKGGGLSLACFLFSGFWPTSTQHPANSWSVAVEAVWSTRSTEPLLSEVLFGMPRGIVLYYAATVVLAPAIWHSAYKVQVDRLLLHVVLGWYGQPCSGRSLHYAMTGHAHARCWYYLIPATGAVCSASISEVLTASTLVPFYSIYQGVIYIHSHSNSIVKKCTLANF